MKSSKKLMPVAAALGLACCLLVLGTSAASAQAIVSTEAADGSVELSNTNAADNSVEPLVPAAGTAQAPASAKAESAEAEPAKDPRELHRDLVLQVPDVLPAGTSAASRRYKKVDMATYRTLMQNNAAQSAQ
jgi:hypothetical protein